jgi:hypothetical protein
MNRSPADLIEAATGLRPLRAAPLTGGCIGEVWRVAMPDGATLVAKTAADSGALALEGWMLDYLARHSALPGPKVVHADDRLLLMEHIDGGDPIDAGAERHAAELLAALHAIEAPSFGLERDTPIGGLAAPFRFAEDRWEFVPSAGIGAYHNGNGLFLGGTMEFHLGLGLSYGITRDSRIGIAIDHISNAGTHRKNPGVNSALVTWSFEFRE